MIRLKSKEDVDNIRIASKIWNDTRKYITSISKVGITTHEIDLKAKEFIESKKAICAFHGYGNFPGYICISVNEELIHGIGNNYKIKDGDLISYDIGIKYNNRICDAAFSIIVGKASYEKTKILEATKEALQDAIEVAKINHYAGEISYTIEATAKKYGYEVIKDFSGHGCGIELHEDPKIPCYDTKQKGVKLIEGMVLCIEPMLMTGSDKYITDKNEWTIIASNKKLTCHCEHMVLITKDGNEVLTKY